MKRKSPSFSTNRESSAIPRCGRERRERADSKRNAGAVLVPPKRGKKAAPRRGFQPLPKNSCWIENDAYDRRIYGYLRAESASLRELEENGSTFLPHFGSLLQD